MLDLHNSYFIILISGVALFLYAIGVASSSLEKLQVLSHAIRPYPQRGAQLQPCQALAGARPEQEAELH